MDYYTSYSMDVINIPDEETAKKIVNELEKMKVMGYAFVGYEIMTPKLSQTYDMIFYGDDSVKWHDSEEDITKLSLKFPECKFKLSGCGDDFMDIWEEYFFNGESELCQAAIPDPVKIKWP